MVGSPVEIGLPVASAFPRILAIDDAPEMRALLEDSLANFGFEVRAVAGAQAAMKAVRDWAPEAILLDAGLAGFDSFSLLASLRRITDMPILMLTTQCETPDKVSALIRGADDCVCKPLDLEELAACIRARLRRPRMELREVVTYADLTIDVTYRKVARAGKPVELSTREFDLLLALARHPEHVFTRSQLLDLVWGADREVTPATVETYISYLRSKISIEGAPDLIETLRGVGYTMRLERAKIA
jgi:DNA-binding response OmpR family regulator